LEKTKEGKTTNLLKGGGKRSGPQVSNKGGKTAKPLIGRSKGTKMFREKPGSPIKKGEKLQEGDKNKINWRKLIESRDVEKKKRLGRRKPPREEKFETEKERERNPWVYQIEEKIYKGNQEKKKKEVKKRK